MALCACGLSQPRGVMQWRCTLQPMVCRASREPSFPRLQGGEERQIPDREPERSQCPAASCLQHRVPSDTAFELQGWRVMCLGRNATRSPFWIRSPAGRWGGRGLRTHTAGPVWEPRRMDMAGMGLTVSFASGVQMGVRRCHLGANTTC